MKNYRYRIRLIVDIEPEDEEAANLYSYDEWVAADKSFAAFLDAVEGITRDTLNETSDEDVYIASESLLSAILNARRTVS